MYRWITVYSTLAVPIPSSDFLCQFYRWDGGGRYLHLQRFTMNSCFLLFFFSANLECRQSGHAGHSSIANTRTVNLHHMSTPVRVLTTALKRCSKCAHVKARCKREYARAACPAPANFAQIAYSAVLRRTKTPYNGKRRELDSAHFPSTAE